VNPQGSSATVVARLTALDSTVSGKAATNQTMYVGTTAIAINRSSASQTLTGTSIDGNAATATLATTATTATTAGNLSGTQTAKFVYAAPNGANGTASFRALLASDVPTLNQDTTGNASTVTNGVYTTDTGTVTSTMILDGTILNADINASAAIADTKLAQITTANKVSGTAITSGNISTTGSITTSGSISTTGGGSITSATNVTAGGFNTTGTTNVTVGVSGSTGGNIVFATTGGTQSLIAATGGTGSQTLPATAGTILNSASAIDVAKITTGTTLPSNVVTSSLTTVGTIGSGTWQGSDIGILYGGTGHDYGSPLVGKAVLVTSPTKATNDTTPEAVFRTSAGVIQYFNVEADTTYAFDGMLQLNTKASAGAAARLSLIYVATGSTSTLTEQSARIIFTSNHTASSYVGVGGGSAANTNYDGSVSSASAISFHINFRGFIRTNATTAGRINLGATQSVAGTSAAPDFILGSFMNVYKVGSGATNTLGNWTA
jgi:hypothetical protein